MLRVNKLHLLAIPFTLALHACAPAFTQPDPDDMTSFATARMIAAGEFELGYVEGGTPGKPLILFIHGTPGSWHGFQHLLRDDRLRACCHMIAVDRLGFGASASSGVRPKFTTQSQAIANLFALNQTNQLVVAGHSLGGSIATDLAIRHPESVDALLVISSALDPELSSPRWYHRLAALPIIRSIIPADLRLANEEMLILDTSLANIANGLSALRIPVRIIQGGEDPLVDPRNPAYAEQRLSPDQLQVHRFPDDGHFIIWEQPEVIIEQLLELVAETEP